MITFKYRLDGPGWANATLANEQSETTIRTSYIRDAAEDLFAGEDDFLHFCSEVDRALDALLDEWGAEGYLEQWIRYRFPQEAHAKLKRGDQERAAEPCYLEN